MRDGGTEHMTAEPRVLILAFSPIANDARVLKQVRHFVKKYRVTTCGYGPAPAGVDRHFRIPDDVKADDLYGRWITAHLYRRAYWRIGGVRWAREHLVRGEWDVVIANDVETIPLALRLNPVCGVHADLHEYSPRLHEEDLAWKKRIKPFYDWLCRSYVTRATSWTTVSAGLAREYEAEFGFRPVIVTNAAPFSDLEPTCVGNPIRLVHSGACLRTRNLTALVDGVMSTSADVCLDLYLTANDPGYLEELRRRASGSNRVTVQDPIPYDTLIGVLNEYDVGVHVLPPANFNNEWALPNKLFDYVQARLGVVVGPSAEMRSLVEEYRLGSVTDDFSSGSFRRVIEDLTGSDVAGFKESAHRWARDLSAETQVAKWDMALTALLSGKRR